MENNIKPIDQFLSYTHCLLAVEYYKYSLVQKFVQKNTMGLTLIAIMNELLLAWSLPHIGVFNITV